MMDPGARRPRALERLAVPVVLALALVVRVREALRTPLWFDELYTRDAAGRAWPDMLRVMRADVHPPLQFVVARLSAMLGGGDLAARSAGILFSLGAILLVYRLARELFGRPAALLATLLVALHPWHVYVSQEARSYSLLWLALALAWLSAWRWCEHGRGRDALLYVLGAALALWTHYLAGVLLAVVAAWGVVRLRREPRRLGTWALLHLAVGVLFAPLLPLVWEQFHRLGSEHWLKPPHLAELFRAGRQLAFGRTLLLVPALVLAALPFADPRTRRPAAFVAVVGPLTVLLCWVLGTQGVRVFAPKYMLFAAAPFLVLVAAGVMRLPGRVTRGAVAALLVLVAAYALWRQPPFPEAASFGAARARLANRTRPGDLMFHSDAHTYLFGRRYFPALRHRLLAMGQAMPYWDGRAVIPDSAFGDASELRDADAAGRRWWAVAFGRGAVRANAFGACADSLSAAPADTFDLVRLWRGERER
jgi:4-amino-4-deoxy-L-arabinose transferase-like glycosyltransferase